MVGAVIRFSHQFDGILMSGTLPQYLRGEIDKRGWDASTLSRKSGVDKATLSNILNDPDVTPKLHTLDKLARALDIPLRNLIQQAGFDLGSDRPAEIQDRIAQILEAEPALADLVLDLAREDPQTLQDILVYVRGRREERRRRLLDRA